MTLVKRGRIWWVDYTVAGKRHRQSTGTGNRKIAESWMSNIQVAKKMPTFESAVEVLKILYQQPVEGLLPVDAILDIYEKMAKATGKITSTTTTRMRRYCIERLSKWLAEKRPTVRTIENVSGPIAADFASHLAEEGLKTKTRKNIIGDLSAVWRMLEKASDKIRNPWTNLAPTDVDGEIGKAFSPEQEKAVLDAAKKVGKDWYPICMIMRITGLRYGDVARLTWAEIDGDVLRLDPHKTKIHKIKVAIPIIKQLSDVIAAIPKRGDFLFPVHSELYGNRNKNARREIRFRDVLDAAGIKEKGYTVHSWRHTAATRLAASGADLETRKRLLGHTVDATARRYDHDEHLEESRQALAAAMST